MKSATLKKIVLIGASTGGPGQIQKIISSLPVLQNTSIIIAQHMVEGFLESFASRLKNISHNPVKIICEKEKLESSTIYVAEGTIELSQDRSIFRVRSTALNSYNPDINTLFKSFIPLSNNIEILSVILTGIGNDGVDACIKLSQNGSRCITESEKSAIVDGMPNRARALVPNIETYEMDEIIQIISEYCNV